jgi:hypothetical protein
VNIAELNGVEKSRHGICDDELKREREREEADNLPGSLTWPDICCAEIRDIRLRLASTRNSDLDALLKGSSLAAEPL